MKAEAAYRLTFQEYPDVVNIEQMCQLLGGISTKVATANATLGIYPMPVSP